ncbi:MAG: hypothetical protein AABW84_00470 [Nanoarchaeota archaeon]
MDKQGQMHVGSAFDIVILLFGVLLGVALVVYAVRQDYVPLELLTGVVQQP